ncbi:MAG: aldo/keto reductase [Devosia sp.]
MISPDLKTKRTLGNRHVCAIGLGCMSFAGFYGEADDQESLRCLSAAMDLGVDHLDTAERYGSGHSESVIGTFLKQSGAKPSIATKGGIYTNPKRYYDNGPEALRASLEGSLKRLGVDHIDLYYIHRREEARPIEEVMETLVRFIDEGKIGAIGFSEIAPASLRRAHAVHKVAAVQSEYSLWTRQPELGLLQACKDLGVTFVAFSPLGRGIFAESFPDPDTFAPSDFRTSNPRFMKPNYSANLRYVSDFRDYVRDRGWSPAAAAIAWALDQGDHVLPIPGTRTVDHLKEIVGALDIHFTDADRDEIARRLPVGFAHGARYSDAQTFGIERYC